MQKNVFVYGSPSESIEILSRFGPDSLDGFYVDKICREDDDYRIFILSPHTASVSELVEILLKSPDFWDGATVVIYVEESDGVWRDHHFLRANFEHLARLSVGKGAIWPPTFSDILMILEQSVSTQCVGSQVEA